MAIDFSNYINTYKGSSVLQQQFPNMNDYLALFGYGQSTTPSAATTSTTPSTGTGVQSIINQNINQFQQGGGDGLPTIPISQRIANFNQAIDTRQNRLNNPGAIASFFYEKGVPKQDSVQEMLSRGMLGAKDTRLTSGIPFGVSGMIAKMLPSSYYDKMTLGDQILTQSYMGYTDPNTNMPNKDPFGRNVISGFGNYAEAQQKSFDKLSKDLSGRLAEKYGVTFNPTTGKYEGLNADEANRMTEYMRSMYMFDKIGVQKKENITADLALIQKAKDQEKAKDIAAKDLAAQKGLATASRGFLNSQEAARMSAQEQGQRASRMGGGSRQAKSGSQKAGGSGRKDGGWGWKSGGLVTMFKLKG